jgi:hypothetical protein
MTVGSLAALRPRLARRTALLRELVVVGLAFGALVVAQLMISAAVHGTNFTGADGKMAQAIILAAQRFSGFFEFNNLNPIQGLGSQLLPINVWLNPVYALLGILGALLLFASSDGLWSILLGAFGAMLPDPLHTIHAHFPHEPLRTLQRFHRWIHTDKRIKEDIVVGVGSQIAFVAVMVGLTMVAHYGVLDPALAK